MAIHTSRNRIGTYTLLLIILLCTLAAGYSLWHSHETAHTSETQAMNSVSAGNPGGQPSGQTAEQPAVREEAKSSPGSNGTDGRQQAPAQGARGGFRDGGQLDSSSSRGTRFGPGGGFGGFGRGFGGSRTAASYAKQVAIGSVLLFVLSAALYAFRSRLRLTIREDDRRLILWSILGSAFLLRITAAPWAGGHPYDLQLFKSWASSAAQGLSNFYAHSDSDYPPFYIYFLYAIGKLASLPVFSSSMNLLIKLPSIFADVGTGYLLFRLCRKRLSYEWGIGVSLFYIFNPAVWINSVFWGQVDSFLTFLVVLAVFLLAERRIGWFAFVFTAAVLMKPQAIVYGPVLFFELMRLGKLKHWLSALSTALVTGFFIILPFSLHQEPDWLLKLYRSTMGEYPYATVNGYNFFSLIGMNYTKDSTIGFLFSYHTWGIISIVLVTAYTGFLIVKARSASFVPLAALMLISGVFTFSTGMHERYLFPAVALALTAFAYLQDKKLLWLSAGFSITVAVNTYAILYGNSVGPQGSSYSWTMAITSAMNVLLFASLAWLSWTAAHRRYPDTAE